MPAPFSFELTTERFRAFGLDLASLWHEGSLLRSVGGREVRISPAPGGVLVQPFDNGIAGTVRHLLGAGFDLAGFAAFARRDAVLAGLARRLRGFRPPLSPDPFETLVTSISAQQVSLRAAFAIRNRLVTAFGRRVGAVWEFPTPERLATARPEAIAAVGYSRRKAEAIVGLARSDVDPAALAELGDDDVKAVLRELPGIGEWTADWYLARHLGRPRAWPAGDLALRKAVSAFYAGGRVLSTQEVRAMADRFAPFENLSAHYLLTGMRVGAFA